MKYCANCGKQMNDGDNFCPGCGTPQKNSVSQPEYKYSDDSSQPAYTYDTPDGTHPMYAYDAPSVEQQLQNIYKHNNSQDGKTVRLKKKKQKSKRRLIPLFGAAAVLLVLLFVFLFKFVFSTGSPTKNGAVKAYFSAINNKDGEAMFDITISKSLLNALEEGRDCDRNYIIRLMRASMTASSAASRYRYVKITDIEDSEDYEIKKTFQKFEDLTGVSVKVSDMCKVEVTYEIWNSYYEEWRESTEQLVLYKSGGNWYVMPDELNF